MNETFIVNIMYQQNASWQGTVNWVQGKKSQSFRSALELIHLIDSAMEEHPYQEWKEDAETNSETP